MATFKVSILEHQKREDGKYPVLIRITNNRKSVYVPTGIYVQRSKIKKDFSGLVDRILNNSLEKKILDYEELIKKELGMAVKSMTVYQLRDYLTINSNENGIIDFVSFAKEHIKQLRKKDPDSSYPTSIETTLNSLVDFFGRDIIAITEITSKKLQKYAEHLKTERTITRKDQFGREASIMRKGVSERTVDLYLTNIRTVFNQAVEFYNDEENDVSIINHYPFKKIKIKSTRETAKRNLPIEVIGAISEMPEPEGDLRLKKKVLARDIFMLSFMLVGTNVVDLFLMDEYKDNRISYKRKKTRSRRDDKALISIRVEPEVKPLFEKYMDPTGKRVFKFYKMYSTRQTFLRAVNDGLEVIGNELKLDVKLKSYFARHSWATIARNKCNISKDDINLALNHVDPHMNVTDIYIEKDWTQIDRANRKVLNYFNKAVERK